MQEKRQVTVTRKISRRARRIWLSVKLDGQVVLTVPMGMGESAIERFLRDSHGWLQGQLARMARYKDDTFLPRGRREYLARREDARALVHGLLARFEIKYQFRYRKVFIKNLSRNWGSCSELGNLNFNYKLALLPPHLAEYVVFHELCHLEAFDHSPKFWTLVAREFPAHRALRKELRRYHP